MVKDMVEIYKCKYLLPCGYCDKYNTQCKADRERVVSTPAELYKNLKEEFELHDKDTSTSICNHAWYYDSYIDDINGRTEKHVCNYCGKVKYVQTKIGI